VRITDTSNSVIQDHLNLPNWHTVSDTWVGAFAVYSLLTMPTDTYNFATILRASGGGGLFLNHNGSTNEFRHATIRSGTQVGNSAQQLVANTLIQRTTYADRTNIITRRNGNQTHATADADANFTTSASYVIGNESGTIRLNLALRELIPTNINRASDLAVIEANQITAWSVSV
jgi:hypothetical protein